MMMRVERIFRSAMCSVLLLAASCVTAQVTGSIAPHNGVVARPPQVPAAAASGIPQDGLIADVPFTEQTGTVAGDASGHGNNCTFGTGSAAPSWNGIGIGEGVSVNEWCSFPSTLPTQTRTAAVCAYLPAQVEMAALNDGAQGLGGVLTYPTLLGAQNRNGLSIEMTAAPYGTQRLYYQQSTYYGYGGFGSGTNDTSIGWNCFFFVLGSTADSPATVDHLYKNGVEVSSYAVQTASASFLPATGQWYLGGGGFEDTLQFTGTFEHVLMWNRTLTAAEVSEAWSDLQAEMIGRGVNFIPPTSQTTNSVAVCLGDSQTSGYVEGVTSWCSDSYLTLPPQFTWELHNNGEQGTTCVSMESGVPAEEALNWSPKSPHSAFLLYCGINDITVGELTGAEIWQRQLSICGLAKAAGYEKIVDVTVPSWAGQDAKVEALNQLIRQNWQSCFTGVADLAEDPRVGASGAYNDFNYFLQLAPSHMKDISQRLLGGYVSNVLASMYGNTATSPAVTSSASFSITAADNFVQVQTAGAQITLPGCLGYVPGHTRTVTNHSTGAISVYAERAEGINGELGPLSIPAGETGTFTVELVSPVTAGCTWSGKASAPGVARRPGLLGLD